MKCVAICMLRAISSPKPRHMRPSSPYSHRNAATIWYAHGYVPTVCLRCHQLLLITSRAYHFPEKQSTDDCRRAGGKAIACDLWQRSAKSRLACGRSCPCVVSRGDENGAVGEGLCNIGGRGERKNLDVVRTICALCCWGTGRKTQGVADYHV